MSISLDQREVPVTLVPTDFNVDPARKLLTAHCAMLNADGATVGHAVRRYTTSGTNWGGDCTMLDPAVGVGKKLEAMIAALTTFVGAV